MPTLQLKDFVAPEFSSLSWIISFILTILSIIFLELYNKQVLSKVNLPNVHFGRNLKIHISIFFICYQLQYSDIHLL